MGTHSSILAWRIPRTEQPSGLQSGNKELDTREHLSTFLRINPIGSCLRTQTMHLSPVVSSIPPSMK